jgi:pimeloyl-ACP methyl ester carboxylesterase
MATNLQQTAQPPLISAKWLLSALAAILMLAVICVYATFCLLFYQGSWQLIFHPSRTVTTTPASVGITFDDVRFDYTETGKAQLSGWWIPAESDGRYAGYTILLLRNGHGSLSDSIPRIKALHMLGINVFAFDYRGFGQSMNAHPSEQRMNQDADAAWRYLTDTRHLPGHSIIFYGEGLGASIAASSAIRHAETPALVLEDISPTALTLFAADARTKFLPVRLLSSDRFDSAIVFAHLKTPKLFIEYSRSSNTGTLFHGAEFPKRLVQLAPDDAANYAKSMRVFLDEITPK